MDDDDDVAIDVEQQKRRMQKEMSIVLRSGSEREAHRMVLFLFLLFFCEGLLRLLLFLSLIADRLNLKTLEESENKC